MRTTGKSLDELAVDEQRFLEHEAARNGMSVGEPVHGTTDESDLDRLVGSALEMGGPPSEPRRPFRSVTR